MFFCSLPKVKPFWFARSLHVTTLVISLLWLCVIGSSTANRMKREREVTTEHANCVNVTIPVYLNIGFWVHMHEE